MKAKRKIALLIDSTTVPRHVKELADWIRAEPDLELTALIIHGAEQRRGGDKIRHLLRTQGLYATISRMVFGLVSRAEAKLFLPSAYRTRLGGHDIAGSAPQLVTTPVFSTSGHVCRFSAEDLAAIQALDLDILVRGGSGILKGGILSAARHGIVSPHHGDNRVNRGGPAGFWEVFHRRPYTGFIVQRLTEELDAGDVLFRGSVTTAPFYLQNRVTVIDRSVPYIKQTIRRVLDGKAEVEPPTPYARHLHRTPLLHDTVRYLARTAWMLACKGARRALGRRWRWGVGFTTGDWRAASLWRGRTIANPPGHFLADPFAFEHGGRRYIFVEDYDYATERGSIAAYEIDGDRAVRLGTVLDEEFHLSFPYLFRHGGEIYMIPECADARQVRIYRCRSFPLQWELAKVALDDVHAIDPMIFRRDGRWWMLTTITKSPLGNPDAEMFAFSADDPLGTWAPHPLNPLIVDASRGRNGGIIESDGEVYRVGQQHAFARYGAKAGIYRIDRLTAEDYAETLVGEVEPGFLPGLVGTHHMHASGGLVVYDYLRSERVGRRRMMRKVETAVGRMSKQPVPGNFPA